MKHLAVVLCCVTVMSRSGHAHPGKPSPALPVLRGLQLSDLSCQRVLAVVAALLMASSLLLQALFIDNWRVLHGREAFTGYRQLCGCYLTRDDVLNTARLLGLQA